MQIFKMNKWPKKSLTFYKKFCILYRINKMIAIEKVCENIKTIKAKDNKIKK